MMLTQVEQVHKEFEALCRFMGCEWSLERDNAGVYLDYKADAAFIWFQRGFQKGAQSSAPPHTKPTTVAQENAVGEILAAAYNFKDAHMTGNMDEKQAAHTSLKAVVCNALAGVRLS